MSIATELQSLNDNVLDAYGAVEAKGGTAPANKNTANLSNAITTIPSGGGVGIPREVSSGGLYGTPHSQQFTFSLPSNATDVAMYALAYAFYNCPAITSADLSSLTEVNAASALNSAFYGCTALTSVDLSSLTKVASTYPFTSIFSGCTSLTSVDLSSLATVQANGSFLNAFSGCTNLTSMSFPALTTVNDNSAFSKAFKGCTRLGSLSFSALTASSFGSYTTQFDGMLTGVTGCTLHFPAAAQAKIETLTGYPNFGGTNTTVLFDL